MNTPPAGASPEPAATSADELKLCKELVLWRQLVDELSPNPEADAEPQSFPDLVKVKTEEPMLSDQSRFTSDTLEAPPLDSQCSISRTSSPSPSRTMALPPVLDDSSAAAAYQTTPPSSISAANSPAYSRHSPTTLAHKRFPEDDDRVFETSTAPALGRTYTARATDGIVYRQDGAQPLRSQTNTSGSYDEHFDRHDLSALLRVDSKHARSPNFESNSISPPSKMMGERDSETSSIRRSSTSPKYGSGTDSTGMQSNGGGCDHALVPKVKTVSSILWRRSWSRTMRKRYRTLRWS